MTDDELIRGFETCALEPFPHQSHVRVAWCYLQRAPILTALARFRAGLQRFAASKGKPDRYHETITVAFMLLIAERLAAFYSDELLASARARDVFVMADRGC